MLISIIYYYVIIPRTWCFHIVSSALAGGRDGLGISSGKSARTRGRRTIVDGGWCTGEDEGLSEEDRAKGIILIAPDFLSSPLCDPGARFLVYPLLLPAFLLSLPRSLPTASSFPSAGSSKSFLRLIFPSNLHAAVIKGLGRGTSSGRFHWCRSQGLVLVLAVRTPSKQWRVSWVPSSRSEAGLVKFQRI